MEHSEATARRVAECERTKRGLDEKNSSDPVRNLERSMAVYALVKGLEDEGWPHPQAEAARLLGVTRTVPNRHVLKVRKHLESTGVVWDPA